MKTRPPRILQDTRELDFLLVLPWFADEQGGEAIAVLPGVGAEFPYSMAVLTAYLERCGFSAELLDLTLESTPLPTLEAVLQSRRPKVVGISSYSANICCAEIAAAAVKRFDETVPTVLGGFHATAMPEECLQRYPHFDYVMYGECELSIPTLLTGLLNGTPVDDTPNLARRCNGSISVNSPGPIVEDLDDLPFPALDKLDTKRYRPLPTNFLRLPTIGMMCSRGCPFKCTFCGTHFQWNKRIRKMSPGHAVDGMQKMAVDYGIRDFRFYDDTFTVPRRFVLEFCEEIIRRRLRFSWNCYSRVDTIDRSLALLMKRAGCYHMKFGVEAGTPDSLTRIGKNIALERALHTVRMVKKLGIEAKASFILGIDQESLEDSRKTVDFACRLGPDFATFLIMMIYPGSEDYENWKRRGLIPHAFQWDRPLYARENDIDALRELLKKAYRRFYLRPGFFRDRLVHFIRHPVTDALRSSVAARYFLEKSLCASRRWIGDGWPAWAVPAGMTNRPGDMGTGTLLSSDAPPGTLPR